MKKLLLGMMLVGGLIGARAGEGMATEAESGRGEGQTGAGLRSAAVREMAAGARAGEGMAARESVSGIQARVEVRGMRVDTLVPMGLCLENYTYPYPVKYITLNIQKQELKMAYMDVPAEHPNGHTVMLLHGKNFGGAYWVNTIKLLTENGYRVIVPDQIGFGKSSKPDHLQYSFQLLARNTKAVLDSAGVEKVFVVGHSMGGMLATRFTLMYQPMVERLILEDPIGLEDWKLKVPYQSVDDFYKAELKQNYASYKKYEMDSYFHGTWSPAYDEWLNIQAGWTLSPEYARVAWNSALLYEMIFTQPVCYEFSQIKVPTLLIVGELDRTALGKNLVPDSVRQTMGNYPMLGKVTRDKIPDCKLIELSGVGHIPHLEAFSRWETSLMDFLNQ